MKILKNVLCLSRHGLYYKSVILLGYKYRALNCHSFYKYQVVTCMFQEFNLHNFKIAQIPRSCGKCTCTLMYNLMYLYIVMYSHASNLIYNLLYPIPQPHVTWSYYGTPNVQTTYMMYVCTALTHACMTISSMYMYACMYNEEYRVKSSLRT